MSLRTTDGAVHLTFNGRRHAWIALIVAGFFLLAESANDLNAADGWNLAFVACTFVGLVMWLRTWGPWRWIVASFPFWAMTEAVSWFEFVALGMVFYGMAVGAVGPTLPGRRRRSEGAPLPHLASGPLVPVTSRVYPNAHPSRVIRVLSFVFGALAVVLPMFAFAGWDADIAVALALSSAIIALTFAFSNWFSGRVRLRIDGVGLHSRLFFREYTIAWNEIAFLSLRYVFLPGMGVRVVYYCVRSPTREFAFPSSMANAAELQASIESATGLTWAVPEITPNL